MLGGNVARINGIACVDGFNENRVNAGRTEAFEDLSEALTAASVDNCFAVEPDGADFGLSSVASDLLRLAGQICR